ncbi:hypothetical protein [Anaerosporobacter sp.]|uniref:hypothetical protein n=1 Tax=Anaerosporobacter sp. TaxID=1872529 RepID=UPI00286F4FB3|nr:hypothetical protein [Anaerosporobacter sp.]
MLTEEQIYLNISEGKMENRTYKYYEYNLNGNETFDKNDMALYGIDAFSVNGDGEWLDLSSLKEYSCIRALSLSNRWYKSVDILQEFAEIEHFRVRNLCDSSIPFDRFRKLYSADVNYDHKTCQLLFDNPSIEFLRLHNYKQKSTNDLMKLRTLKRLTLEQCKIENLDFLEQLTRLKSFRISYNRSLKSIQGIAKNKNLKAIEIRNCKKIEDWNALSEASQLEYIILEDCGEIDSLAFLENFPNLKVIRFIGNTEVKDGKLKSIVEKESLEYAKFPLCKHYDITRDDLHKFLFGNIGLEEVIDLYQVDDIDVNVDIEEIPVQNSKKQTKEDSGVSTFGAKDFFDSVNSIKESMEEYLEEDEEELPPVGYTIKEIQSFETIINEFLMKIEQNQKSKENVLGITKETILELNQLNNACDGELIETGQREEIVSLILDVIEATGVEVDGDITLEWRKW